MKTVDSMSLAKAVLRMDDDVHSKYYSFPLFVCDYELLNRKIPVISFMHDGQLVTDPMEHRLSGSDMVRDAFSMLRQKEATWQAQQQADLLQYVFTSASEDSIAEKILDPSFMQIAADMLGCERLEIMLPHTHIILARDADNHDTEESFKNRVQEELSKIQVSLLSDIAYIYADGQIKQVFSKDITQLKVAAITEEPKLSEGDQVKVIEIPVFTGDYFYKVEIGAASDSRLIDLCEQTIFNILNKGINQPRFLGTIEFVIDRASNPASEALDKRLTQFWDLLQKAKPLQDLVARLKRNVELSIIPAEYMAQGESYKKKHLKIQWSR